ncbi:MAG TPA: sulfatase [Gaiellaceae bacterium]|nr:sulfatase [Gaiellaceae bacterium]
MAERPNIVLLVLDSVRVANVSCYGYERETTPALDELARQGALFEQAISVGCWTLPVHTTVFTGLYPFSHGVTISRDALPEGAPTLARRLREIGYGTVCFSNNPYISAATGLTQGFETVEDLWRLTRPRGIAKPKGSARLAGLKDRGGPAARVVLPLARMAARSRRAVRAMRAWRSTSDSGARLTNERIRAWLDGRQSDEPFFVFVNYMESHERYAPPYPYGRRFMRSAPSPLALARANASKAEILGGDEDRRARDIETVRSLYDGCLRYLDERVGELVEMLRSQGILDDTVVIVASDHGDSLGEHGFLGHRLHLYEPLVHVPLVIRYPKRFPAGTRVSEQVQLGDLFPTILDLSGAEGAAAGNGFKSLAGPFGGGHAFTVAENTAPKSMGGIRMRMVRDVQHKLIWRSDGKHELYDLTADPGERSNRVLSEPALAGRLIGELDAWEQSLEADALGTSAAEYDDEVLERLRGLGYIE